ncbi:hypothetical protein MKX03_030204 [Papaver bracteatum]|nr:hypothetical protein MKX03_030204 [Papaver bracteatum]
MCNSGQCPECGVDDELIADAVKIKFHHYAATDHNHTLRVQWGYSECNQSPACIYPIPRKFNIHGLWLYPARQGPPCPGPPFTRKRIKPSLETDMLSNWPSIYNIPNADSILWGHEWRKHGRCSGISHNSYFIQTLLLYGTQTITNYVVNTYPPGPSTTIDVRHFHQSLQRRGLNKVTLHCNTDGQGRKQLVKIGIYFRYKNCQWFMDDYPGVSTCGTTNTLRFPYY